MNTTPPVQSNANHLNATSSSTQVVHQGPALSSITISISDIRINHYTATNPHTDDLRHSIQSIGLLNPITVSPDKTLLAGLRRLKACEALGWTDIPARVLDCDDLTAELVAIDENLVRNELTVIEHGTQLLRRKEIYEQLHPETKKGIAGSLARQGRTSEFISFAKDTAQKMGVSERTIQHEIQIATGLLPKVKADIEFLDIARNKCDLIALSRRDSADQLRIAEILSKGEATTYAKAEQLIYQRDIEKQKKDIESGTYTLPEGEFEIICMDVPWHYEEMTGSQSWSKGRLPYPTMSLDQIAALEVPAAKDCILFFWTTHRYLKHSFDLLEQWGFKDVSTITWVKGKDEEHITPSLGVWLRSQSEYCIMAIKGHPSRFIELTTQGTVLVAPRREHSRKPDAFYEMVESLCCYSTGRKLDYFAREARPGWETFGNEVNKFDSSSTTTYQEPHSVSLSLAA